MYDEYFMT